MNILILGGSGMLGPHVVPALEQKYNLRVTDINPPPFAFRGEFRQVDVANAAQVMQAAEGMDAIINLSVLRQDRQLAFDVNTLGCWNMMQAAVAHGIQRVINTGPHFTIAGATYEEYDFDLSGDIPPQPGTNLYALSKSLGQEICRVFAENHDLYVQTYLFYIFRDPANAESMQPWPDERAWVLSWKNSAQVFDLGLQLPLDQLPSRCEIFNILGDLPHGQFNNNKAKRILGFTPWNDLSALWTK
jgi:UDP-glucose 4-epimerase